MDYFYSTPYRNNMAQLQLRRDVQNTMRDILWLCTTDNEEKSEELRLEIEQSVASQNTQLQFLKENNSN